MPNSDKTIFLGGGLWILVLRISDYFLLFAPSQRIYVLCHMPDIGIESLAPANVNVT